MHTYSFCGNYLPFIVISLVHFIQEIQAVDGGSGGSGGANTQKGLGVLILLLLGMTAIVFS